MCYFCVEDCRGFPGKFHTVPGILYNLKLRLMKPKKNSKADLGKKRVLFLEIGLVVALAIVVAAFSLSSKEKRDLMALAGPGEIEEFDMIDITRDKPEVKAEIPRITILIDAFDVVDNNKKITFVPNFEEFAEELEIPQAIMPEASVEDDFVLVSEVMPSFMGGGLSDFHRWVSSNIIYPEIAKQANITGKVHITFIVEKNGKVSNINVLLSPDETLSKEAVRVIASSPDWSPGFQGLSPVRLRYNMSIDFKITD